MTRWVAAGGDEPAATVSAVVARVADALGLDVALVVDGVEVAPDPAVAAVEVDPALLGRAGPWLPGFVREVAAGERARRRAGIHHTAPAVAAELVGLAASVRPIARGELVADPAVGGGAFLLAALDRLPGSPDERVAAVRGCDVDPLAVGVTEAALALRSGGIAPGPGAIRVADGLDPDLFGAAPSWVIGNPPFLSQLRDRTSRDRARRAELRARWGDVGGYVDEAAAFVLAAVDTVAPGGVVALVQPASFLAARDTAAVRARLAAAAPPVVVWTDGGRRFEADVDTVACVLLAGAPPATVRRVWGVPAVDAGAAELPEADSWAPLLAGPAGPPARTRPRDAGPRLGDVATVSSGFRDQYYGLRGAVVDDADGDHPLVTTGLIDPLTLRWGTTPARFDRTVWTHPTVRLDRIADELRDWLSARLVPKLLVATQTRVIEAAVDSRGTAVPCTPVVTVVPRRGGPSLAHLAAALTSPVASAELVERAAGTGLSAGAVRVAAPRLAELTLPPPGPEWDRAARLVASLDRGDGTADLALLSAVAGRMLVAHGLAEDDPLGTWWRERLPRRYADPHIPRGR